MAIVNIFTLEPMAYSPPKYALDGILLYSYITLLHIKIMVNLLSFQVSVALKIHLNV